MLWVWRGLCMTHCGMRHLRRGVVGRCWLSHGRCVLWKQRPLIWSMRLPCLRCKYDVCHEHWVLHLLLVSPTRTFLCLVFDPLCNKPYIVGSNTEELAIVNLIAEQEGIEPRPQKVGQVFG